MVRIRLSVRAVGFPLLPRSASHARLERRIADEPSGNHNNTAPGPRGVQRHRARNSNPARANSARGGLEARCDRCG